MPDDEIQSRVEEHADIGGLRTGLLDDGTEPPNVGMADMRARAFKSEGFHTFATTWERIRDSIGTVRSEIEGSNRSDPPQ